MLGKSSRRRRLEARQMRIVRRRFPGRLCLSTNRGMEGLREGMPHLDHSDALQDPVRAVDQEGDQERALRRGERRRNCAFRECVFQAQA